MRQNANKAALFQKARLGSPDSAAPTPRNGTRSAHPADSRCQNKQQDHEAIRRRLKSARIAFATLLLLFTLYTVSSDPPRSNQNTPPSPPPPTTSIPPHTPTLKLSLSVFRSLLHAMPSCNVCLTEARDVGVFPCKHSVCRSCGLSQSSCLVCRNVGENRRIATSRVLSRKPIVRRINRPPTPDARASENIPAYADPIRAQRPTPSPPPRQPPPNPNPDASRLPIPSIALDPLSNSDEHSPQPPPKLRKTNSGRPIPSPVTMRQVFGPTAFDEVRCELRPALSAPKIQRSALRTTGRLSIALLIQYIRDRLQLTEAQKLTLKCSGEDLTDAMTLGDLVSQICVRPDSHLILDYGVTTVDP